MNVTDIDTTGNKPVTKLYDVYSKNYANATPGTTTEWTTLTTNLSNHQIYALNNQRGFNRFTEVELSCQIPTSLFLSNLLIPPGTPISLSFTVDRF